VSVADGAILGAAGGTVSVSSGNVTVLVPAQALGAETTITVAPTVNPLANANLVAGSAFDFGPSGTTFAQPVTIQIKYPATLPGSLVADRLRLNRLTGGAWVEIPGSTVDVATRTVSGQTSSFSTYAVLQQASVATNVTIGPSAPTVIARATQTLMATVIDQFGSTITPAPSVSWQSSDQAVATVSAATGVVTAVSPGTTTITATSGTVQGTTVLTVVPANVNSIVESIRAQYNLPAMGGAIITRAGKMVAIGVAGNRRWGTVSPVTTNDLWHLGSDTKTMTAFLAQMSVKAGKFGWTDLMTARYPELASVARPEFTGATLRTLGTMQSGITGNPGFTLTGSTAQQRLAIDQWAVQQPPEATPGTYYYSNISYQIMAEIIGRAWGNGYEQALRDQLWTPLGITSGGFGPTTGVGMSDQPNGHTPNGGGWTVCESCDNAWATGSGRVHMSLPDWSKLMWEMLRADAGQSTLLSQAEARTLTTGVTLIDPSSGFSYAYGWEAYAGAPRIVTHDGSNTFNYSRAVLYLDAGVGYLLTTNAGGDTAAPALSALTTRLQTYFQTGQ
jgi:CubicO group peptidase (beta-lactamase class C family)